MRQTPSENPWGVHGGIRPFLNQNPSDVFDVGERPRPPDAWYIKHPAAARDDLRIIIARFFPVGNKIKLNMPPVCMAVYIHNHRLRSAAVHSAYDVKHPFWSHASVIHVLRPSAFIHQSSFMVFVHDKRRHEPLMMGFII